MRDEQIGALIGLLFGIAALGFVSYALVDTVLPLIGTWLAGAVAFGFIALASVGALAYWKLAERPWAKRLGHHMQVWGLPLVIVIIVVSAVLVKS